MPNDRKTMLTLHELRVEEAAIPVLVDSNGAAFPVKTYSEFKLGAVAVAAGWGLRLADLFGGVNHRGQDHSLGHACLP